MYGGRSLFPFSPGPTDWQAAALTVELRLTYLAAANVTASRDQTKYLNQQNLGVFLMSTDFSGLRFF